MPAPAQSGFIQAKIIRQTSVTEQVVQVSNAAPTAPTATLDTSVGRLSLPKSTAPSFLIQLIRGLS